MPLGVVPFLEEIKETVGEDIIDEITKETEVTSDISDAPLVVEATVPSLEEIKETKKRKRKKEKTKKKEKEEY